MLTHNLDQQIVLVEHEDSFTGLDLIMEKGATIGAEAEHILSA